MMESVNLDMKQEKKNSKELNIPEQLFYASLSQQMKNDADTNWGLGKNIVLISDRCEGRVKGMAEYFRSKTMAKTVVYSSFNQFFENSLIPDFLIMVGYQKDKKSYKIIDWTKENNANAVIVMNAVLDGFIKDICKEYQIDFMFDSYRPMQDFIGFLQRH